MGRWQAFYRNTPGSVCDCEMHRSTALVHAGFLFAECVVASCQGHSTERRSTLAWPPNDAKRCYCIIRPAWKQKQSLRRSSYKGSTESWETGPEEIRKTHNPRITHGWTLKSSLRHAYCSSRSEAVALGSRSPCHHCLFAVANPGRACH